MNQLPTYSKLIVNHHTNKPLLTTIVHMAIYLIYHLPSECMGRDISTPLHSTSARIYLMCLQSVWARIYPLPFTAGRPGNIMCLQSACGRIYPLPFTAGRLGNIMCLQSAWAGIYPLPFTAGQPGNIMCLQSTWAGNPGIYHSPSLRTSQEISHASRDQST